VRRGAPYAEIKGGSISIRKRQINTLFVLLISHQPAVLFSQKKPATSNQPAVLNSQNKSAPATSNQSNEHAVNRHR
jgi:hypothetical protein